MNISMLVLNNFTNDARVHKEATTLASAGYKVLVIALWQQGLAHLEQQSGYQVIRLRLHSRSLNNRLLSPLIKYLEFAWQIWRLSGRNPAQIYHANDANTLPAAWLASKRNHAKLVYDAHELETGRNFSGGSITGIYRSIWTFPEKIFINKVQSVITVSPSIANMLEHQYHVPLPHVILNCPELKKTSNSNRLRQELNIPENCKILLYQGRVAIGRGIETFLNAVQQVENAVGVVLGDGPALETLRDRLRSGEWERVYFLGQVPLSDLPSYTASADLGVVLTQDTCLNHHYSLPNKLFEYLHAGLPVICNNLPEMARVVQDYQVGELTDSEDPSSIAKSIQSILSDPIRFAQMKANTYKVAENYNWQNESKKLLKVYSTLDHG
jgi:glycosyltransferase involved in cell wall biosynthesis